MSKMSGDTLDKRAKQLEMARKVMEKRIGVAVDGSSAKRPGTTFLRTPSSRISGLKTTSFEGTKASRDAIAATTVSSTPPAAILGEKPPSASIHAKEIILGLS